MKECKSAEQYYGQFPGNKHVKYGKEFLQTLRATKRDLARHGIFVFMFGWNTIWNWSDAIHEEADYELRNKGLDFLKTSCTLVRRRGRSQYAT